MINKRLIVAAISASLALSFIDMTAVSVSLPQIQRMLHASTSSLHWVVNAYLLALAVFIMFGGYLGDRYGHRKLFVIGTIIFSVSSLTCAFAHNIAALNISRFFQGFGSALFTPNSSVMIFELFPEEERGKQMGIMVGSASFFLAIGPLLGGFLTQYLTWRAIFWINLPLTIFSLFVIIFKFKIKEQIKTTKFDIAGTITLGIAIATLVTAFMQGTDWGWSSTPILVLFIISALTWLLFVIIENYVTHPIINFQVFRNKIFLGCCIIWLCLQSAMIIGVFRAIWLQDVLDFSPLIAGLLVLPSSLPILIMAPLSGRLLDKYGLKVPLSIGLTLGCVGMLLTTVTAITQNYWHFLPGLILMGLGIPLITTPTSTTALSVIEQEVRGVASGTLNTMRQLGGTLGLAISSAIISSVYLAKISIYLTQQNITGLTPPQLEGFLASRGNSLVNFLNPQQITPLLHSAKSAYTIAFIYTSLVSTIILIIAAIVSWFLIVRHPTKTTADVARME